MTTNMDLLRGKMKTRRVTQRELANKIGMDPSTLSRKLSVDGSNFTVGEMRKIVSVLELSTEECKEIFLF